MTSQSKPKPRSILIVEDDAPQLGRYLGLARSAGLEAHGARAADEALQLLARRSFQLLLTDIHLGGDGRQGQFEGLQILQYVKRNMPEVVPLAMTADPKIETYERVLAEGALHLFRKPILNVDELLIHLNAAKTLRLTTALARQRPEGPGLPPHLRELCPDGVVMSAALRETARKIAAHPRVPVVISGETGTGKEEVAKLIYRRRLELEGPIPFVAVNCATLHGDMATSALFGHRRGAFTGADETTNGFIGEANGGILFLDEIQTLTMECQQRLLRVLNDGSYTRLGHTQTLHSDFQVIVASTRDLDDEVEKGCFLLDLRSRLIGIDIYLPPLRERKEDLPLLVELFLARRGVALPEGELGRIAERCREYHWRGNVRQLFQVLQVLLVQTDGTEEGIRAEHLPVFRTMLAPEDEAHLSQGFSLEGLPPGVGAVIERSLRADHPLQESVALFERFVIQAAIARHGKLQSAAFALGIGRSTLDEKRRRYGLDGSRG